MADTTDNRPLPTNDTIAPRESLIELYRHANAARGRYETARVELINRGRDYLNLADKVREDDKAVGVVGVVPDIDPLDGPKPVTMKDYREEGL